MKIIQLAVSLNNEGVESLYAVTDDGRVLQRRWAAEPRQRIVRGDRERKEWTTGWTEGWIEVSDAMSVPVHHSSTIAAGA